jgi:hypothetical protein
LTLKLLFESFFQIEQKYILKRSVEALAVPDRIEPHNQKQFA